MNNLEMMRKRFEWQGGIEQENRMIKDKFRTLQRALKYSYQACSVSLLQPHDCCLLFGSEAPTYPEYRALINSDKVKQDYDDKILSIPYFYDENGKPLINPQEGCSPSLRPGDVFEWRKTDTAWIIYLQELVEDAYFRGEIRRCRYKINFTDTDGVRYSTWAAIRGPVETQIDSIQKNQERIDKPNLSLNILVPSNERTVRAFERYSEFLLAGRCWQVKAPDSISMNGVIEIAAEEDYINKMTDDIENDIKNGLVIEPATPRADNTIKGETFIIPKTDMTYSVDMEGGSWKILGDAPASIKSSTTNSCVITWNKMVSGQFTLQWYDGQQTAEKVIVVESLY